ncbi:hypothetical protein RO3G_04423 [Rhizopus delemar RA 99-880]|uniref:Uncharacterized protein n=1 Tax=Rhizopus delemar (strain RA 99-880 / ATCC MYA-4621 / FGSC 9543 / NRRL 43880) TaxID=246409 RepID=I1BU38_RHIO9|nr:hypothetical protein RO3G_04423 [Rhizopus delemar RA 99-880]|eukprot:EIE79718.1 hypothetical protein RO3G_04423 [Rhizopus delemar RA 99-880]
MSKRDRVHSSIVKTLCYKYKVIGGLDHNFFVLRCRIIWTSFGLGFGLGSTL